MPGQTGVASGKGREGQNIRRDKGVNGQGIFFGQAGLRAFGRADDHRARFALHAHQAAAAFQQGKGLFHSGGSAMLRRNGQAEPYAAFPEGQGQRQSRCKARRKPGRQGDFGRQNAGALQTDGQAVLCGNDVGQARAQRRQEVAQAGKIDKAQSFAAGNLEPGGHAQAKRDNEPEVEGVVAHMDDLVQIAGQPFAAPAEDGTVFFPPQLAADLVQRLDAVDDAVAEGQAAHGGGLAGSCGKGQHHAGCHAVGGSGQVDFHRLGLGSKVKVPLFFFNAGKRFHRLNQLEKIAGQTAVAPDAGGLFFPGRAQGLLQCRVKAAGRALPGQHAGTAHHHAQ